MDSFHIDILQPGEVDALLALLKDNLLQNITTQTAASQGFLTFQYSEKVLKDMMHDLPQPVAKHKDMVIGYALATSLDAGMKVDLLKPLIELFQALKFKDKLLAQQKFYIMGQICVKEGWRQMGVFDAMYNKHRELFSDSYDCIVTEIAEANHRSFAAHTRVGFKTIHNYFANNTNWRVVVWDWK